jgi:S-methylmethionine-dependent homocysteine/selenocysteine methylase
MSVLQRDSLHLADGGLETVLLFHDGFELPCFAAFPLVETDQGVAALRRYYESFVGVAARQRLAIVLDAPTWRANADWGTQLGYDEHSLAQANREAVELVDELRRGHAGEAQIVISGPIGPRGDAYAPDTLMTADEATRYHRPQISTLAESGVDLVTGLTLTYSDEAIGIARAASDVGIPVVISFTVETDGRLPSGETLKQAITRVDEATEGATMHFMVNCAHPSHFASELAEPAPWLERIGGLRCNASAKSHAELDESEELDEGDIDDLALQHRALRERLPWLKVLGGCCGTDHRHVDAIGTAWLT